MDKNEFYHLFLVELRDLYSAENQLLDAIPLMVETATNNDLKKSLQSHLEETKQQVKRLKTIFASLSESPTGEECAAMRGLIQEGKKIINTNFSPIVKDAALIACAQRIEHYEMAGYGVAKTFAKHLDLTDAASLLKETLAEEGNADKTLTSVAEGGFFTSGLNALAAQH
jgi:ferritin-like metal-binding protein YciE